MRKLLLLSALLFAGTGCAAPAEQVSAPQGAQVGVPLEVLDVAATTWIITVGKDGAGWGSCVAISTMQMKGGGWRTLFLTAKHVVSHKAGINKVVRMWPSSASAPCKAVGVHPDPHVDLALVEAILPMRPEVADFAYDKSGKFPVPLGRALYALGYPLDPMTIRITVGFAGNQPGTMTTPIAPGNSGGPVVLEDGRVVGVGTSIEVTQIGAAWHVSHYTPVDLLWLVPAVEGWALLSE